MTTQNAVALPAGVIPLSHDEMIETNGGLGPLAIVAWGFGIAVGVGVVCVGLAVIGGLVYAWVND